jgi:hypothetical protein
MLRSLFSGGEQTLHTDSATFSLSLAVRLAGELGVRFLTLTYGNEKMSMEMSSEEEANQATKTKRSKGRTEPSSNSYKRQRRT